MATSLTSTSALHPARMLRALSAEPAARTPAPHDASRAALGNPARRRPPPRLSRRLRPHQREPQGERGPLAGAATLRVRGSAVRLDDVPDDGEPEAEAAVRACGGAVGLAEALEDEGEEVRANALARVAH